MEADPRSDRHRMCFERSMGQAPNDAFHEAYGRAHEAARRGTPVLIVIEDELRLELGGRSVRRTFASPRFHGIKTTAHVAIAAYIFLSEGRATAEGLTGFRRSLETLEPSPLLERTRAILDRAIGHEISREELVTFARRIGPELLAATEEATRIQLQDLHAATEGLLAPLSADERGCLMVVVTGDHQARVRSLAMQYFQKRLGEPRDREERVLYGEAIADADEALALVGKTLLDRELARAFFDDPHRLQRDILGDAAQEQLAGFDLRGG